MFSNNIFLLSSKTTSSKNFLHQKFNPSEKKSTSTTQYFVGFLLSVLLILTSHKSLTNTAAVLSSSVLSLCSVYFMLSCKSKVPFLKGSSDFECGTFSQNRPLPKSFDYPSKDRLDDY